MTFSSVTNQRYWILKVILPKVLSFIVLQISIFIFFLIYISYIQKQTQLFVELRLLHQNTVLKENFVRVFDNLDTYMEDLKIIFSQKLNKQALSSEEVFSIFKESKVKSIPVVSYTSVLGANGVTIGNSEAAIPRYVNVSDRPYFIQLKDGKRKVYFGPYFGRTTDTWTYASTYRLDTDRGMFNGVLLASVSLNYLAEFCKDVTIEEGIDSYILNSEDQVMIQCGLNKISIDKTGKDFISQIVHNEFNAITPKGFTSRYESPNLLMFANELPNGSGMKIITLSTKEVAYKPLDTLKWQSNIFLAYIGIAELCAFFLFLNAVQQSAERRVRSRDKVEPNITEDKYTLTTIAGSLMRDKNL